MTLLADHDVWAATLDALEDWGHDVVSADDVGLSTASDRALLEAAATRNRLLITRDRDFGRLVFLEGQSSGILLLRISPSTQQAVHDELNRVLEGHLFDELHEAFTVVEPGQHRIRRPR